MGRRSVFTQDSEVSDQHQAAFLEFDHDQNGRFSRAEVSELLSCMDKAGRQNLFFTTKPPSCWQVEALQEAAAMEEDEEEDSESDAEDEDGSEEDSEEGEEEEETEGDTEDVEDQ